MHNYTKFLFASCLITLCSLFSCSKVSEEYPVKKYSDGIEIPLKVDDKDIIKNYEVSGKDDVLLDVNHLKVSFNNKILSWSKEIKQPDYFFLCANETYPTNSVIKNLKIVSSAEKSDLSFFVAYIDMSLESPITYVSQKIIVHITNSAAIKPWVWFLITGVVIFGVVGMVFYTKHYKETHGGK